MEGAKNIGSLDSFFVMNFLKKGSQFILGGAPWKVRNIDYKRFRVKVEKDKAKEGDVPDWSSEGGVIDSLISRKIYDILIGNYNPDFMRTFDELAQDNIHKYIAHARDVGFREGIIPVELDEKEHRVYIYTFAGMRANALLSSIFSLEFDTHSVMDTAYFSSFKFRGEMNFENISKVIYDVENILREPEINKLIDEKTKKFVKNKFINFLPYDDNVKLKMELLYGPEDLIKVVKENSVSLVGKTLFRNWR
jgi:ATP-dependent Lhr-like helicase